MGLLLLLLLALLLILTAGAFAIACRLRRPPRKTYAVALARGLPTDPEQIGRPSTELTLRLANGHDSPAWLIPGDQPQGPVVILIHGFGDSRLGQLTWAHLFTPHASQLLLFDLPGHGEADGTCQLGTREADDIINILDQIDTTQGVVLFGYSMGAGIAIAAAASQDPRIKAVIADGPYPRWHQPVANFLRARRWPVVLLLPLTAVALRLLNPRWQPYDRVEQARHLSCPLLVLHGRHDPICHYDDAVTIASAAPQGQLIEFPDSSHLDLAHRDETRYRTALKNLFDNLN
ncbi:alpha/beta hydrolase [Phycisphaerales bacterium AB-hyl4]|uniref:Alpha/beta hydrolase n=1 Tax=Natronomicrosphaera hydrolytica TaxID=3242702 RepID=A0ABV4U549_9BACT